MYLFHIYMVTTRPPTAATLDTKNHIIQALLWHGGTQDNAHPSFVGIGVGEFWFCGDIPCNGTAGKGFSTTRPSSGIRASICSSIFISSICCSYHVNITKIMVRVKGEEVSVETRRILKRVEYVLPIATGFSHIILISII